MLTSQKFIVFVFNTEIGRLCSFNNLFFLFMYTFFVCSYGLPYIFFLYNQTIHNFFKQVTLLEYDAVCIYFIIIFFSGTEILLSKLGSNRK